MALPVSPLSSEPCGRFEETPLPPTLHGVPGGTGLASEEVAQSCWPVMPGPRACGQCLTPLPPASTGGNRAQRGRVAEQSGAWGTGAQGWFSGVPGCCRWWARVGQTAGAQGGRGHQLPPPWHCLLTWGGAAPPGTSREGWRARAWPRGGPRVSPRFRFLWLCLHCAFVIIITERAAHGLVQACSCDYITDADFQEASPGSSSEPQWRPRAEPRPELPSRTPPAGAAPEGRAGASARPCPDPCGHRAAWPGACAGASLVSSLAPPSAHVDAVCWGPGRAGGADRVPHPLGNSAGALVGSGIYEPGWTCFSSRRVFEVLGPGPWGPRSVPLPPLFICATAARVRGPCASCGGRGAP